MLKYRDEDALECFCKIICETDPAKLSELDIADATRSLAHFDYDDYDCLKVLIKQSIRRADSFKLQTLAVVLNSFAELGIANDTLLTISKQSILAKIDRDIVKEENKPLITG